MPTVSGDDPTILADHFHAISRLLRQAARAEAYAGDAPLTVPQAQAMEALVAADREGADLSLSELATRMGLAHSTVSGIVDRLERRGLLRRVTWAVDRRQVRLELTQAVRDWLDRYVVHLRGKPLAGALAQLNPAQTAVLAEVLPLLRKALEADT